MNTEQKKWYEAGYAHGLRFAWEEADYDELAAVARAGGIPRHWDIFRAEIINQHMGKPSFDFQAYAQGFGRACIKIFEKI
jgi:hypothetical protein